MKLRGGSFGLVVLVIVMAVVLILVAQAWEQVGPGATVEAVGSGDLPGLNQVRETTDAHSEEVGQALTAIE